MAATSSGRVAFGTVVSWWVGENGRPGSSAQPAAPQRPVYFTGSPADRNPQARRFSQIHEPSVGQACLKRRAWRLLSPPQQAIRHHLGVGKRGRIDGFLPGLLPVEMKSTGEDVDKAYLQATESLPELKTEEIPRLVIQPSVNPRRFPPALEPGYAYVTFPK
jgi:hypothetical protein